MTVVDFTIFLCFAHWYVINIMNHLLVTLTDSLKSIKLIEVSDKTHNRNVHQFIDAVLEF